MTMLLQHLYKIFAEKKKEKKKKKIPITFQSVRRYGWMNNNDKEQMELDLKNYFKGLSFTPHVFWKQ